MPRPSQLRGGCERPPLQRVRLEFRSRAMGNQGGVACNFCTGAEGNSIEA